MHVLLNGIHRQSEIYLFAQSPLRPDTLVSTIPAPIIMFETYLRSTNRSVIDFFFVVECVDGLCLQSNRVVVAHCDPNLAFRQRLKIP